MLERRRLRQLLQLDPRDLGSLRETLRIARQNRVMHPASSGDPWERVRFAVLEPEALVAGLDDDVERKTFPQNFTHLAGLEGLAVTAHEHVVATSGDAGTHVFALQHP